MAGMLSGTISSALVVLTTTSDAGFVEVGGPVTEGQMIANAGNGLSVPQYASIGGRVTFVDPTRIIIEAQDA